MPQPILRSEQQACRRHRHRTQQARPARHAQMNGKFILFKGTDQTLQRLPDRRRRSWIVNGLDWPALSLHRHAPHRHALEPDRWTAFVTLVVQLPHGLCYSFVAGRQMYRIQPADGCTLRQQCIQRKCHHLRFAAQRRNQCRAGLKEMRAGACRSARGG